MLCWLGLPLHRPETQRPVQIVNDTDPVEFEITADVCTAVAGEIRAANDGPGTGSGLQEGAVMAFAFEHVDPVVALRRAEPHFPEAETVQACLHMVGAMDGQCAAEFAFRDQSEFTLLKPGFVNETEHRDAGMLPPDAKLVDTDRLFARGHRFSYSLFR